MDVGEGEFVSGLPVYPLMERGGALATAVAFRPQVALYAWPPPGQCVAPLCQTPFLHYLIIIGEAGGGTGTREDWAFLPHQASPRLSRYGWGRTGSSPHQTTIFHGPGPQFGARRT